MHKLFGLMVLTLTCMIGLGTVGCGKKNSTTGSTASSSKTTVEKTSANDEKTTVEKTTTEKLPGTKAVEVPTTKVEKTSTKKEVPAPPK